MDVEIDYTNHRGERGKRRIRPMKLTWGLSEWHTGNQWILLAHCFEKNAPREFAMSGIHAWVPVGSAAKVEASIIEPDTYEDMLELEQALADRDRE